SHALPHRIGHVGERALGFIPRSHGQLPAHTGPASSIRGPTDRVAKRRGPVWPHSAEGLPMTITRNPLRACVLAALLAPLAPLPASADETCNSPYMASLIKGQEDFVYVWTLGVEGLGDGQDK